MKKISIPDDVHERLKAYKKSRGYADFGIAIDVLLTVRDVANKDFQAVLSLAESRSKETKQP